MSKTKSTLNILIAVFLIIAMAAVTALGIPFMQISGIGEPGAVSRSMEFSGGYQYIITATEKEQPAPTDEPEDGEDHDHEDGEAHDHDHAAEENAAITTSALSEETTNSETPVETLTSEDNLTITSEDDTETETSEDTEPTQKAGSPAAAQEVAAQLQRRASHLGSPEISVSNNGDGTLLFRLPFGLEEEPDTLALRLTAPGVVSITNDAGDIILPRESLLRADVGYGQMSETTQPTFYIQFTIADDAVDAFAAATAALAEAETADDTAANVMYINLDGSPILQASVSESMTQNSFVISGNFEDASLPLLYAEYINGGELPVTLSANEAQEFAPTLFDGAFLAAWLAIAVILLLCGLIFLICYRKAGVAALSLSLVYALGCAILFLTTDIRFSIPTLAGLLLGLLLVYVVNAKLLSSVKRELSFGKNAPTAAENGCKKSLMFYAIVHIVILVVTAAIWILWEQFGLAAGPFGFLEEVSVMLFFANLFSALFSYWNVKYWINILLGLGLRDSADFGLKKQTPENNAE